MTRVSPDVRWLEQGKEQMYGLEQGKELTYETS